MRILRALAVFAALVAVPLVAQADLWVNVNQQAGSTYGKALYVTRRGNCKSPGYGGELTQCTNEGQITFEWAQGPQAARDGTCVLSVWASGARPFPLTWHMDLSKNERGMCSVKWANDNTLDVEIHTLPDYYIDVLGPPNDDHGTLNVYAPFGCRNHDTADRHVRCSRGGTVTAFWSTSSGRQPDCKVVVQWFPWPVNGLAPIHLPTPWCSLKKIDKTHAQLTVKPVPTAKPK